MFEVHHPILIEPQRFSTYTEALRFVETRTELSGAVVVEVLELPFGD